MTRLLASRPNLELFRVKLNKTKIMVEEPSSLGLAEIDLLKTDTFLSNLFGMQYRILYDKELEKKREEKIYKGLTNRKR